VTRRDLTLTALTLLVLVSTIPAYDRAFSDTLWRGPALLAALGATLVVLVARALRRGVLLTMILSAIAAVAVLPWILGFTTRPVVPRPAVVASLSDLLDVGLEELAVTPAPAATTAGLALLVALGWWAIAHVAIEAMVRIRRPGAALLAATVLWVAPLVVPLSGGRTWPIAVPFLAAIAVVLLVVQPEGLPTPGRTGGRIPTSGIVLAVGAIGLAALAPGVLPGYEATPWVGLGASPTPRGYQPIVDISERLRLPQDRDVLRVEASQRSYLRLAGLDTFDGATWRLGPAGESSYRPDRENLYLANDVLPPEQPAGASEDVRVAVEVLELENIYVPVPYQPVQVLGPQRDRMFWSTDGGFLAIWENVVDERTGEVRAGLRQGATYQVQAQRPTPDYDELLAADVSDPALSRYTELPRDYDELRELATSIYAEAGATTAVDQALALQDWFTGPDGGFTYDLDVPALPDDQALTDFVLEDRVGYCEYFATAMAVMLRATDIPARVAVGFLPGRITQEAAPEQGRELTEYTVSTSDAHAWVEVLFPGHGWITFEPTPRDDSSQVVPTADDLAPIENLRERRLREAMEQAEAGDPPSDAEVPEVPLPGEEIPPELGDAGATDGGTTDASDDGARPVSVLTLMLLAAVVAIVAVLGLRRRRRRHVPDVDAATERVLVAQRELLHAAAAVGLPRHERETIREVTERWATEGRLGPPPAAVVRAIQAAAFGGLVLDDDADAVERWAGQAIAELRASVSSRDRLTAPIRVPAGRVLGQVRRGTRTLNERRRDLVGPRS
jgi:transglutaminase-like putative cysteine protease